MRDRLLKEASGLEWTILLSCKGHFAAAGFWSQLNLTIGLPAAAAAAVSGGTALADRTFIAGVLAIAVAIATGVAAFLNATERHKLHHAAGNEYSRLARTVRMFRQFEHGACSDEEFIAKLKEFQSERDRLNEQSPQVPRLLFLWGKRRVERDDRARRKRAELRRAARAAQ